MCNAGIRADTSELAVIVFESASALKHFLQDKSKGAHVQLTGVRSISTPDNFEAYYALKFDGPCIIISSSTDYNFLPASLPRCPAAQYNEVNMVVPVIHHCSALFKRQLLCMLQSITYCHLPAQCMFCSCIAYCTLYIECTYIVHMFCWPVMQLLLNMTH